MSLPAGARLGPYEIVAVLGAGGMGEVYRARDPRIGRDVAVKILPHGFANDGDRLKRFELEARAAGILNHPNLLTIFDLGVLPMGAGEARTMPVNGLEMMVWWDWFPDEKRLAVWGNEPDRGNRLYEVAIHGDGTVRPITPEGVNFPMAISPDGAHVALTGPDENLTIYSVNGESEPRVVPGSLRGDQIALWGKDGALYVHQFGRVRVTIERIDLSTGERTKWQELKPDPVGVMNIQPVFVSANLQSYAYSFRRFLSELLVVKGLL